MPTTPSPPLTDRIVVARAPARLDLAGGWTDVPPYADEVGGCVCNVAIARYATVRVGQPSAPSPAPIGRHERASSLVRAAMHRAAVSGVAVEVWNDYPIGAGLGGSSAAGVALAAALATWRDGVHAMDDTQRAALAEWSRAVEVEDAGIAGGRQDHYAAAFGGASRIDFGADAGATPARVTRLALDAATLETLERRCVVLYTGESRISGDTITAVLDAYAAGARTVVSALARMKAIAREIADALVDGRVDDAGRLLGEHWTHQRALHPSIPTARIDLAIARAATAGALGAKALGASGGGCVLALAADGREDAVRSALATVGELVPFTIDRDGVAVERR